MNSQFDLTEVLYSHIDLVLTKLDQINSILFHGSPLDSAFSLKSGSDVADFIRDVEKAKLPKMGNSVKKFISEHSSRIINVAEAACYCLHWCDSAIKALGILCNNSLDLDIRWNYMFSIRFCQIFVALCKVLLFFSYFTNIRNCITLSLHIDGGDNNPNLKIPGKLSDFSKKAASYTNQPFSIFQNEDSRLPPIGDILSLQLGQLISQIGPFLIQVIGEWPLLDWQDFVIFNRIPKQQSDSTLPNMEHIVLANLQILVETSYFFSFCFPLFISEHPQFLALMNELTSETELVLVSKATSIPISHIIATYNCFLDSSKSKNPKIKQPPIDEKVVASKMNIKFTMSHKQRLNHLVVILKDIMNLCECEAAYLPMLTYDVISLCGFAYYELSIMLLKNDNSFKPQVSEDTEKSDESTEILQIIDILVRIAKIYCKYERHIMRFFVYNIATVDLVYFTKLFRQYCGDSFDWQTRLTSYIGDLCYQIQENVKLDEFDNGIRYDFIPFIYTHGRILHYYNYLKIDNHIAYLQTIFEHLETIRIHMLFAQSPIQAFLTYCPIHTLWRSYLKFADFLKNAPGGIHLISSIINLFSFFNHDSISMSILTFNVDNITKMFTKSRADVLNYIYTLLNTHLDEKSLMMKVIKQNRFDMLFDPSHFIRNQADINLTDIMEDTQVANTIWQMKELLLRLPDSITFNQTEYPICSFIAQGITNNLGNMIFKKIVPDAFLLDSKFSIAAQIVWPLYTMLNASFSYKLYQSKYEHGNGFKTTSLSDMIFKFRIDDMQFPSFSKIKSTPSKASMDDDPSNLAAMIQYPKIINTFIESLKVFLAREYFDILYLPYRKKFVSMGNGQYLSLASFESLFLSLGLVSAFHIDHLLIQNAAHTMADIFFIFIRNQSEINKLLDDFRKGGITWMSQHDNQAFQKAGQMMIKLGVILKIRELVREAMKNTMDKTIIGFSDLVSASAKKQVSDHISDNKDFFVEITTAIPDFHFIESFLSNANIEQCSDPILLFFFFAILLSNSQWKKVEFESANETITHNLHLFPVAVDAFLNLFNVFCQSSDSQIIGDGMGFFFSLMFQFINKMKASTSVDIKTSFSFIILIDLFPKIIKVIEYGRVSQSFPSSIISTAYKELENPEGHPASNKPASSPKSLKKKK